MMQYTAKWKARILGADGEIEEGLIPKLRWVTAWKVSVFGVILVGIFPHLDWIRRDMEYLSVFSPNAGKYGPE